MPATTIPAQADLASQLTDRFGPLLTQSQLAELLGRSAGGCATASAHRAMLAPAR